MRTGRLEAFSDGVLAIIITIMVLELRVPRDAPNLGDLKPIFPVVLSYMLSFVYIGIYWNNHHHLFHAAERLSGVALWANLHLLFWLSLVPFATGWMGQNHFAPVPAALYGVVLLMAGLAYTILQKILLHVPGGNPVLSAAVGKDVKGKISLVLYLTAIALCFVNRWISCSLYVAVAMMWLIPDRRIEEKVTDEEEITSSPPPSNPAR
jgi:uncharacterized membrane protein